MTSAGRFVEVVVVVVVLSIVGFALGDFPAGADCPDLWEHLFTL